MDKDHDFTLLIIGGTGVLSSAVMDEAIRQNIKVSILNRGNNLKDVPPKVEVILCDVNNDLLVKEKLSGRRFDVVIDFLCYTPAQLLHSYEMLSAFADQYVFVSSFAVYDTSVKSDSKNGYDEDAKKVLPIWSYSVEKNNCEELLLERARSDGRFVTIVRPGVTYGNTRIPYGVYPPFGYHGTIVQRILNGKPMITWNGGNTRCNIMRVEEFAVGVVGLLGKPETNMQAYNICGDSDKASSWNDVLDSLGKILNREVLRFDITSQEYAGELPNLRGEILGGRSLDWVCDNSKIKKIVPAFVNEISLADGIAMTVSHYRNNDWLKGVDYFWDGDTDRIIRKYSKKQGIHRNAYTTSFVDYLGRASLKDRMKYVYGKHKDNFLLLLLKNARKSLFRRR